VALPVTQNWDGTDQDPLTISGFTKIPGCFSIGSSRTNRYRYSVSDGSPYYPFGAYWSGDSFDNDQYAQVTPYSLNNGGVGPAVRITTSGSTVNLYFLENRSPTVQRVNKIVNGSLTQLGSDITPSSNVTTSTVTKLSVSSTTLTVTNDGTDQTTRTDSTFSSGAAGVYNGTGQDTDNFEAGNVSFAAMPPDPIPDLLRPRVVRGVRIRHRSRVLTQTHVITPADLAQAQSLTSPTITQTHVIQPADLVQAQELTEPTVGVGELITSPGLEYVLPVNRLHGSLLGEPLHGTLPENRLHATLREEE